MPIVTLVLLVVVVALLLALLMKTSKVGSPMLGSRLDAFEKAQERSERAVREEVAQSRDELGNYPVREEARALVLHRSDASTE
jgi:DNA recombination protein RmuC